MKFDEELATSEKCHPSLFISDSQEKLPESGVARVKFRVRNLSRDLKSNRTSYSIDILSFDVVNKLSKDFSRLTGESLDESAEEAAED